MSAPKVCCRVFVAGGHDPTDEYNNLFVLELKPKDWASPPKNKAEEEFQLSQVAGSVADLREYLKGGVDFFDGKQNWIYISTDEEEERFVKPLPPPFNKIDAYVELSWGKEDVVFDEVAQLILDLHDKAFTELELQKVTVDELRVIRVVKGAKNVGSRKGELIDSILTDQKSKGLSAVRVLQKTLVTEVIA